MRKGPLVAEPPSPTVVALRAAMHAPAAHERAFDGRAGSAASSSAWDGLSDALSTWSGLEELGDEDRDVRELQARLECAIGASPAPPRSNPGKRR